MKHCTVCAKSIREDAARCEHCGSLQVPPRATSSSKPPAPVAATGEEGATEPAATGDPSVERLRELIAEEEEAQARKKIRIASIGLAIATVLGGLSIALLMAAPERTALPQEEPSVSEANADDPYERIWLPGHEAELILFLTELSELFSSSNTEKDMFVPRSLAVAVRKMNLEATAVRLAGFPIRGEPFPPELATRVQQYLAKVEAKPNHGLWSPQAEGQYHDFTALAAFLQPERPELLREVIEAKSFGPFAWPTPRSDTPFLLPHLTTEQGALKKLSTLTTLTPEEARRLEDLEKGLSFGDEFRLGELYYTVEEIEFPRKIGDEESPISAQAGACFIVASYTVTNEGKRTISVRADELRVVDRKGREYLPSNDAIDAISAIAGRNQFLAQLQPGVAHKMQVAFEVPEDVPLRGFKLVVPERRITSARCPDECGISVTSTDPGSDRALAELMVERRR